MLYFITHDVVDGCKAEDKECWWVGCPFPPINPSDVVEIQADGDELDLLVQLARKNNISIIANEPFEKYCEASAFRLAMVLREYCESQKRGGVGASNIYFTGETVRVSSFTMSNNTSEVIIEKLAGQNVYGEKQWVVVKDPHPQLLELAMELVKIRK